MVITQVSGQSASSQQADATVVDIVAVHDISEDGMQTWTDPASRTLWLRDLLPGEAGQFRVLVYSYRAEPFTSPGVRSTKSILADANNLVAELCADRQLEGAFDRPIIFVCHGFGGLLVKRALAYSHSRVTMALEHLRSIYTCTYGIMFLGTPHDGISKESLLWQTKLSAGPNHFMLSLLKGSEMLNEINDQFAPLMKRFAIFNFWEELQTEYQERKFFVVEQSSAAPAWDNVEKCGIMATYSRMTKFEDRSDRRFRPILEAILRYARSAPALIKKRRIEDAELMDQKRQQAIGELSQPQRYSTSSSEPPASNYNEWCLIPRKPSSYFTGRQKHAKCVRDMLGPVQNRVDQTKSKILVIYGLGGSGKTQFCLKYVEDNKHRYWGVFWVDASSEHNVESGYASIGAQAGRGATKVSAIHWLSQCRQPWLLVLDNADDTDKDISNYLPGEGNGHILVTTRNPNATERATVGHMRFRGMDPPDAVSLLLKAAYPDQQYQAPPATPMRNVLAEGIAIELGYLPLAIAHAGATIRRNIYTLERYLKYYLPQRKSLLSHSLDLGVEEANIITTWEIPFRKIVSRVSTEHKDAVDLMHAFAFMHYETIPERIFQRSWAELRDTIPAPTRPYPDVLQPVWSEAAQARFRRAIGVLCDHSIIEYEREKGLCTMHPVVHNWARDRLSKTEQTYWLQCTTAILAECISPNLEASGRQFRTLLLPHINSCRRLQTSRNLETVRGATEMEKFAWVYAENGQWNIARELQKNVVQFRKKSLGRQHPNTIRAQNSLVQTHWNLFEIKAAGLLQYDVLIGLNLRRPHIADWMVWPVWAPTHTTYCLALSELTSILWLAGDRSRSRYTGERAVAGLKQRLGPEDPLTLKAMFYLARTYLHLGERDRCHELLLWVLKHQKRYFGMKHPDTLMTRNELGMLLCASKQHLAAAQRLVENVLETRKELLGDEHAYTLWSMNDLSKIYIEVGRAEDAVALLESVVPVAKRTLGDDHVGMRMTKSNLGRAYFVCERWKEAEETVRPLFEGTSSDHPDLIHAEYGYAHILYELGRMEEAEGYCVNMIDKIARVKMFSLDHPRTVSIAELLKKIYRKQGREDKIATIRKGIPSVGVTTDRDWFDPYAVRRGSHQPARTHKISDSSGSPETASQLSGHKHTPSSSSSRLRNQDPVVKVIARRTF